MTFVPVYLLLITALVFDRSDERASAQGHRPPGGAKIDLLAARIGPAHESYEIQNIHTQGGMNGRRKG
jgi:hypothetical protein